MSTSVGSIYSSIVLDDSKFTASLRNVLTTANSSLGGVTALAAKTSNSFTQIGIAAGNTDKSIKNTGNTIAGLKARLEELQTKLESSQLGSQKFTLLKGKIDSTKIALENAYKSSDILRNKLDDLGYTAQNTGAKFKSIPDAIASISSGAATLGVAMLAKSIATIGSTYSAQMSQVAAASNASKAELAQLTASARELGATTQFSATQAAEAMTELAKAGLNTNQILTATKDVLSLAQAGSISLGEAATFVADSMSSFGLAAKDTEKIADTLANAANASTISVQDVGESFKYAAGIAKTAGVDIQHTATMIAMLGNAGIKSSMAGTTLKSMFLMLSAPSKEASAALRSLGLSADFVAANLDKPKVLLQKLNESMANVSSANKLDLVATIFGSEPASGVIALMDKVETEYDKTLESISKKGGAAEFGKKATDNLKGDMANLSSAIEEAQLKVYTTLEPILRFLAQSAATIINGIGGVFDKFGQFLSILGPFGDVIAVTAKTAALLGIGLGVVAIALPALSAGFSALSLAGGGMSKAFMMLASAASTAVTAISSQGLTGALSSFSAQLNTAASGAAAKWAMILGPFAAVAAVVYTITYLEKWQKDDQGKADTNRQNRVIGLASSEITIGAANLKKLDPSIKSTSQSYDALSKSLGQMSNMMDKGANSMAAIENAAAVAASLGLKNLSKELNENKLNSKIAKESLDLYLKRIEDFKNNNPDKKDPTSNIGSKGGGGIKEATESLDAFITRAIKLDEITKGGISFNVSIPQDQLDANKATLEKWAKDNKVQLDYTSKFDAAKNKPTIDIEMKIPENITGKQREALKAQIQKMKGVIDSNSLKPDITPKADPTPINDIHAKSLAFIKSWKDFTDAKGMQKFAQGVQLGSNAIQELGGQFANLLQAQAQLSNVKFTNFKQANSWMTEGLSKALDTRYKAIEAGLDNELKVINDERKTLADEEKIFQTQQASDKAAHDKEMQDLEAANLAELKRLKDEYRLSAQTENDLEYQAALQKLSDERDAQIAAMEAETTDEQQRVINRQFIEQSYEESKLDMRGEFDEKLRMKNEENELLLQQKAEEQAAAKAVKEKAFSDKQQADAIARDSAKEARELALNQRAEKLELQKMAMAKQRESESQDLQRKSKMLEWVMGRSSFEIGKQSQAASIQVMMATSIMNAIAAGSALAAATLGFGAPLGFALIATLTGMSLAAGATSLAAVRSAQYPPPPIFESGGMVNGASHAMGGQMIEAEGGEFVVNKKSTAENLDLLQSINNGGGVTKSNHNIVNVGQVQVVVYNPNSTADITNQVSDELMKSLNSRLGRTY